MDVVASDQVRVPELDGRFQSALGCARAQTTAQLAETIVENRHRAIPQSEGDVKRLAVCSGIDRENGLLKFSRAEESLARYSVLGAVAPDAHRPVVSGSHEARAGRICGQ